MERLWTQARELGARVGSEDKPHVGITGVTLHKTRPTSIIEDTNRCSFRLVRGGTVQVRSKTSPAKKPTVSPTTSEMSVRGSGGH